MMSTLIAIVWWIVRLIVFFSGCIPAFVKIVQGRADEDKREFNAGIVNLAISGAILGATFAIEPLLDTYITAPAGVTI